ncbi:hypothetical protein M0R36_08980 [bacterium]|jgi:hypothetical protein|nr:hypothetical protein [bacterium]
MTKKILIALRGIALVTTLILAFITILYIIDIFSGELLKELMVKIIKIMGVVAGTSLVTIFLIGNGKDK